MMNSAMLLRAADFALRAMLAAWLITGIITAGANQRRRTSRNP